MQADQTVLSLRPGGGGRGGSRVLGPRFEASSNNSGGGANTFADSLLFRPHGGGFSKVYILSVFLLVNVFIWQKYDSREQVHCFSVIIEPPICLRLHPLLQRFSAGYFC